MTAESNVIVSIVDPDDLIAGTNPDAPFAVTKLQVFRFTTEALARSSVTGSDNGTLVTTFTLIASTVAVSDPNIAGPYRWGYYDSGQTNSSWYAWRYTDNTAAAYSLLSDPWQATDRPSWTVRDIIPELSTELGGTILTGTVDSAASTSVFTLAALFQSSVRASTFYQNWHVMVAYDAGGASAAPEAEDALIASVNTTSGAVTLERALSAQLAASDKIILCAFVSFAEILAAMNRAREEMQVERVIDIALTAGKNRYPAPPGVKSKSDILEILGVIGNSQTGNDREDEFDLYALPVNVGNRVYIDTDELPGSSAVMRVRYLSSYRDMEGSFTNMASTTTCPIEWMRPAFGWEIAKHLVKIDPTVPDFQHYEALAKSEAIEATAKYAPDVVRSIRTSAGGRKALPGPVSIA